MAGKTANSKDFSKGWVILLWAFVLAEMYLANTYPISQILNKFPKPPIHGKAERENQKMIQRTAKMKIDT